MDVQETVEDKPVDIEDSEDDFEQSSPPGRDNVAVFLICLVFSCIACRLSLLFYDGYEKITSLLRTAIRTSICYTPHPVRRILGPGITWTIHHIIAPPCFWLYDWIHQQIYYPHYHDLHLRYLLFMSLVFGIFIKKISTIDVTWIDSFFVAVSALTCTGLSPLNLSTLNTAQQIAIGLCFIVGSWPFISLGTIWIRMQHFHPKFEQIILQRRREARRLARRKVRAGVIPPGCAVEVPARQLGWNSFNQKHRKSSFHGLTQGERESLLCTEYEALRMLWRWVLIYMITFQVLPACALGGYYMRYCGDVTRSNGVHPFWLGGFTAVSAFNNTGMSLMDTNMLLFREHSFPVFVMCGSMMAGNTFFPIFLRLIFRLLALFTSKLAPSPRRERHLSSLLYILKHPRRVYTHMFPSSETWWLLGILTTLNAVDLVALETSTVDNSEFKPLSRWLKILDGAFQALSVRCSGFNIITVSKLSAAYLTLSICMMYISAWPLAITIRSSNVYEERSLGIYAPADEVSDEEQPGTYVPTLHHITRSKLFFLKTQAKSQLGYDAASIALGLIFIIFIESHNTPPDDYNVFPAIFEVVSAYANIGLSMGVMAPSTDAFSLSGQWHMGSKLILMFLMHRGRARGLPNDIDRAVQLPEDARTDNAHEERDELEREHELERERKEE